MLNCAVLMGRLVADPELRTTTSGISVTSFRIAVDRSFVRQGEERQADFIDIVAWRQTAEFVSRFFSKGKSILVCGAIQSRSYTDQNGQKRYVTEVVADEATFVEKKSSDSPRGNDMFYGEPPRQSFGGNAPTAPADSNFEDVGEDDLPF